MSSSSKLEQRQELICGGRQRIAPLAVSELSQEALPVLASLIAMNSSIETRDPAARDELVAAHAAGPGSLDAALLDRPLHHFTRTMLRHPVLFARHIDVGDELFSRGSLPARDRELAILRLAWLSQAPFEWGEHVYIGKTVGITSDEIERISQGSNVPGWNIRDRAVLSAVEELHADAFVSDASWAVLSEHYDDKQLIELIFVVGQYQTIAYYLNSLRVPLAEGNVGLAAR